VHDSDVLVEDFLQRPTSPVRSTNNFSRATNPPPHTRTSSADFTPGLASLTVGMAFTAAIATVRLTMRAESKLAIDVETSDRAERLVAAAVSRFRASGISATGHTLQDVADDSGAGRRIAQFGDAHGARLIVVGRTEEGRLAGFFDANVTEEVIRHAHELAAHENGPVLNLIVDEPAPPFANESVLSSGGRFRRTMCPGQRSRARGSGVVGGPPHLPQH
jgi:nucleotide-binding universal stress UspA family protein